MHIFNSPLQIILTFRVSLPLLAGELVSIAGEVQWCFREGIQNVQRQSYETVRNHETPQIHYSIY